MDYTIPMLWLTLAWLHSMAFSGWMFNPAFGHEIVMNRSNEIKRVSKAFYAIKRLGGSFL